MSIFDLTRITYNIAGAIYMMVLYTYFSSAFAMRYRPGLTIGIYGVLYCLDIMFMYLDNDILNVTTSVLIYGILIFLYVGNLKIRIISALFIYIAAFIADFITAFSIAYSANMPIEKIIFGTPEFLYGLLASKILFLVFAKILSGVIRNRKLPQLSTLHWIALIATPAGSIFIMHNYLYLRTRSLGDIISSFIVVIINFIVINVYDKILADAETNVKNKFLEEQLKYYSYHSFLAESSEKFIQKTKHDLKNLMLGINLDIQKNKIDNVEKRIFELLGEINRLDGPANSGNISIDAIINFKANGARKQQIYFSTEMKIPQYLEIDTSVICQVLGNALDNAIEATDKIEDSHMKIIQIYMNYLHGTLFIKISNPFEGKITVDNRGRILSAKRGFRSEGIGLQNIRNAVSNECGAVDLSYTDDVFCLSISLYDVGICDTISVP